MFSKFDTTAFALRVERDYGVRLDPHDFYVDHRSGYVYVGSSYVATVPASGAIEDATAWAETIGHMPRGGRGIETATREEGKRNMNRARYGDDAYDIR